MTSKTLARRLDALELARRGPARLVVCRCATANRRENLPSGEHLPDCPAAAAGPDDSVIRVLYEDRARVVEPLEPIGSILPATPPPRVRGRDVTLEPLGSILPATEMHYACAGAT